MFIFRVKHVLCYLFVRGTWEKRHGSRYAARDHKSVPVQGGYGARSINYYYQ